MPEKFADLALRNGAIYSNGTVRPGSVAVAGPTIAYAGPDEGIADLCGPETMVIDLQGGLVLPGFIDSHIHSSFGGLFRIECDLSGLTSEAAYLKAIAAYAAADKDKKYLRGNGWLPSAFGPHGPNKAALDAVVPDRPAVITSCDGHAAWVNSIALKMAGIDAGFHAPEGGVIERDPGTGEPAGTLREFSAIQLVEAVLPDPSVAARKAGALLYMEKLAAAGITAIHDAAVTEDVAETYAALDAAGLLTLHVRASFICEPDQGAGQVDRLLELRGKYRGKEFSPASAKIFLDGVVEGHTAFLCAPYADSPGAFGRSLWEKTLLLETVQALDKAGVQIHIHAIGDAAVRMALDAFEAAAKANGRRDSRHTIAHLELVSPADAPRFRELGIIACFQPTWFYKDEFSDSQLGAILGQERAQGRFRMNSLLGAGAMVSCGSDWPVGGDFITLKPLDSIQIGVSRRGIGDKDGAPYMPEERLDIAVMTDCYTRNGAYAAFLEESTGSLEAGRLADLIVLDRNIFSIPSEEIHKAKVLLTLFKGKIVFRNTEYIF